MKTTLHNPSIADLKKTLFFSDHSSGEIYRQNEDRDIVKLLTIFHDKTPQPSAPWICFFLWGNKTNMGEEPRNKGNCTVFFSFRIYTKKNISHKNPIWHKKWLHQQYLVDAELFEDLSGFCVKCFFLYIRNEKKSVQSPLFLGSSPMFVLVPPQKKYIHGAEGWGVLSWKIVNNLTMSRSSFCRYIFPEYWSRKNDVIFMFLLET